MTDVTWYALFTGIDDYADDTLDIRGAVNDAKAWYAFARRLGLPAERIVMCTSPALTADDLGDAAKGVQCFTADHAGADAACAALCGMLGGNPNARALLAWTGHASSVAVDGDDRGTLLAVSDTDAADGKTMVPLQSLIERIDSAVYGDGRDPQGADAAVLAMIDVCHASAPAVTTYDGVKGDRTLAGCGALALTATQPGEQAHVIEIGGERRGAFSWVVTTLLDRFGFDGGASRLTPAELYYRTRDMLGAIDARQTPALFSITGELNRRLMHGLNADARGAGQAELGDPLELWPGTDSIVTGYKDSATGLSCYVTRAGTYSNGWESYRLYLPDVMPKSDVSFSTPFTTTGSKPSGLKAYQTNVSWTVNSGGTYTVQAPYYEVTGLGTAGNHGIMKVTSAGVEVYSGLTGSATIADSASVGISMVYKGSGSNSAYGSKAIDYLK